jgi:hypothetical protein
MPEPEAPLVTRMFLSSPLIILADGGYHALRCPVDDNLMVVRSI